MDSFIRLWCNLPPIFSTLTIFLFLPLQRGIVLKIIVAHIREKKKPHLRQCDPIYQTDSYYRVLNEYPYNVAHYLRGIASILWRMEKIYFIVSLTHHLVWYRLSCVHALHLLHILTHEQEQKTNEKRKFTTKLRKKYVFSKCLKPIQWSRFE